MIQEILTYLTVAGAFYFAGRGIYRTFFPAPGQSACSGCASSGCDLKSMLVNKVHNEKMNYKNLNHKNLKVRKAE